uniref:Uncharacterized protein n=1 Tax=Glossina austeni TaxID=7395 RepID=A0A1A9V8V0_GLOAU
MDDDDDDGDGADVDADAGDYDEKFAAGVGKVAMPSEASFDVTVAIPLLPLHNNLHHQNRSHNQPSPLKTLAALTAAAATALLATPETLAATAATAAAATAATASLDAIEETAAAAAAADSVNELVEGTDTPVCAILEFDVEAAPLKTTTPNSGSESVNICSMAMFKSIRSYMKIKYK